MAIQDSGAISWGDIRTEFGLSGSFSIGSLRGDGCRPSIPASGAISANDFYSVIARSGQITGGVQSTGGVYVHRGFAIQDTITTFTTNNQNQAFGALSKQDLFVLGNSNKEITAFTIQNYPAAGSPRLGIFTESSTSTDSDWSIAGITDVLPVSSSTNNTYTRNKTDTLWPNKYAGRNIPSGGNSTEVYYWETQQAPESGPPTGGLYFDYFNSAGPAPIVTSNPIIYIT